MTPMLCQVCGQNPATIHFTEIQNAVKKELHICEECANAKGVAAAAPIPKMLFDLLEGARRKDPGEELACPHCGMTFADFRAKGRLGCPHDYEAFREALLPLLDKVHGAHAHTGRLPRGKEKVDTSVADRLLRLRRALQDSVKTENYEDAARLRDEIRALEQALHGAGREG
jgi:protein arginine kinase activator